MLEKIYLNKKEKVFDGWEEGEATALFTVNIEILCRREQEGSHSKVLSGCGVFLFGSQKREVEENWALLFQSGDFHCFAHNFFFFKV